jgi:hypothetical protein
MRPRKSSNQATTVDLPFEPVTAITGLVLIRANSSTSQNIFSLQRCALASAGSFKLIPGLTIT